jgi:uncharacterized protein (UPF0332 family)
LTPEAAEYLAKARTLLAEVLNLRRDGYLEVAAREAYLAAFHAGQALIFERTGRIAKTHSGLRSRFAEIARHQPGIPKHLGRYLGRAYKVKETHDYGPLRAITTAKADETIVQAQEFVELIAQILEERNP